MILQPYDMEMGAGTFHTATFLRAVGPEPWRAAYVQPSRRPTDGRYGENPFRLQHYYQFQVAIKPSPDDFQELYLGSLRALGFDPLVHDIRFVEDNWESPTLGAWGLGWEVWLNGMEVSQFTYFQQVGGLDCRPVMGEITYGLERLGMYIQGKESIFDIVWTDGPFGTVTYGDVFHQNEVEQSAYNFEKADTAVLLQRVRHPRGRLPETARRTSWCCPRTSRWSRHRTRSISSTRGGPYPSPSGSASSCACAPWRAALPRPIARAAKRSASRCSRTRRAGGGEPMSGRDLLFELQTEELPPRDTREPVRRHSPRGSSKDWMRPALRTGRAQFRDAAASRPCSCRDAPRQRRIGKVERRGPPVSNAFDASGSPTQAALAFARNCGVDVTQLERLITEKGAWLVFRGIERGTATAALLPGLIEQAIAALPIARRMRWGARSAEFVRPVHGVVLLHGDEVVPATVLGLESGRTTRGHRFHAPKPIALKSARSYEKRLTSAKVIADFDTRREAVRAGVTAAAEAARRPGLDRGRACSMRSRRSSNGRCRSRGRFEPRFLGLPREVVIATIQDHQRYFAIEGADGKLTGGFVTVSNIESRDPAKVREGNERVVRPRLSDAAFFWEQDRRVPLAVRARGARAASPFRRSSAATRINPRGSRLWLALIGERIFAGPDVVTAAELAKADLLTAMVGEFPELQGIMGRYYAEAEGYPDEVSRAIEEHYRPRFAGDALPLTRTGQALALADKIDTLVGIFAIGERPTGAKDPFGLRRAALGVLRILIEGRLGSGSLIELLEISAARSPCKRPGVAPGSVRLHGRAIARTVHRAGRRHDHRDDRRRACRAPRLAARCR